MKRLILFAVFILNVLLSAQAWAVDCKQQTIKFIRSAQQNDYSTLLTMSEIYQNNAAGIRRNYPKYKVDEALRELFEFEKGKISKWMFTPTTSWKLLETKNVQLSKKTSICISYIKTEYNNYEDAPSTTNMTYSEYGNKIKSSVIAISFDRKTGFLFGSPELDGASTKYWISPLKVEKLKYEYIDRSPTVDFSYVINGGSEKLIGGTPPYKTNILINGMQYSEFMGKFANKYKIEYSPDVYKANKFHITITQPDKNKHDNFEWPPNTSFPVRLKIEISDSSQIPQTITAELLINTGRTIEYKVSPDGVLADPTTQLLWAKDADIAIKKMYREEAIQWVGSLNYAGLYNWRLPTKQELISFAKKGGKQPYTYFNNNGFVNVRPDCYWTIPQNEDEWPSIISMVDGRDNEAHTAQDCFVWPVQKNNQHGTTSTTGRKTRRGIKNKVNTTQQASEQLTQ